MILCAAAIAIGCAGLAAGFAFGPRLDAWLWLVIGFLVFGGIAQGLLVWAAVFRTAQARWTAVVNRLGHSAVGFLPVSLVTLAALLAGAREYIPWITEPISEKQAWLNAGFLTARQLVLAVLLSVLSFFMVRRSLAADAKASRGETITQRDHYNLTAISISVAITYAVAFTIVSYDFVMSLDPTWMSTMFGPYYFVTNLYVSLGALIIMAAVARRSPGVERHTQPQQFQDLGNLMLAFSLFGMGLFFAQYLTTWYANLPWETGFLILRYYRGEWPALGWTAFAVGYAIPFALLQSRKVKRTPALAAPVASIAILGVALERYVLVVPSLKPDDLALAPPPGLVMLAFSGALISAIGMFRRKYPSVSAADEALGRHEPLAEAL